MEPGGGGLKIRKACDFQEPKTMPVGVLAALCRSMKYGNQSESEVKQAINKAHWDGVKAGEKNEKARNERRELEMQRLQSDYCTVSKKVRDFESAFGINWFGLEGLIRSDNGKHLFQLFRSLHDMDGCMIENMTRKASQVIESLESLKSSIGQLAETASASSAE